MEEHCLLAYSLVHSLTHGFLYSQVHLPRDSATHSGLGPSTLIINQDVAG